MYLMTRRTLQHHINEGLARPLGLRLDSLSLDADDFHECCNPCDTIVDPTVT
jgi:hypothetical protein